ncbi:RimK family alpha-L-glutamate ligase [Streptomyces cyaneofuscatus]|uniref:ATP-grasp domain-containing protein n=1 Tax=Streptomyces cyaneofuscatus TaxID=66883 RepID=UPI003650AFE5
MNTTASLGTRWRQARRPSVAVVTCQKYPHLYEEDRPLLGALRERGIAARPVLWDSPDVAWQDHDLVLVRSPWDYPSRPREFLAWYQGVSTVTTIINSYAAVQSNQHKSYLRDLWHAGAPVIPTEVIKRPSAAARVVAQCGWPEAVLKPAISMGGRGVHRLSSADLKALDASSTGDWVVQPLLRRVQDEGEFSLVYINGRPSHAVRKVPARGEIRIQEAHGGAHAPYPLGLELLAVGDAIIDAARARDELIVRVDLIRNDEGDLLLGELELTSPRLFFCHHGSAIRTLADAIYARLAQTDN